MSERRLRNDLCDLKSQYEVKHNGDYSSILIRGFILPVGYNMSEIDLIWNPANYPFTPPGVSPSKLYVPDGLLYWGGVPRDYYPESAPEGLAWWCIQEMPGWNCFDDDLIVFLELVYALMCEQETKDDLPDLPELPPLGMLPPLPPLNDTEQGVSQWFKDLLFE